MNQPSPHQNEYSGEVGQQRVRKTFGWRPTYSPNQGMTQSTPQRIMVHSGSPSLQNSSSLSMQSPNHTPSSAMYGNKKREGSTLNLSQNPTPNTKNISYIIKRDRSTLSTPQRPRQGLTSPPSSSRHPGSVKSTPVKNRVGSPGMHPSSGMDSSNVAIKKAASSPVFSRNQSEETISKEFLDRLATNEVVELSIQPERGALGKCLQSLQELEVLCNETSVMKVRNPITKMKDRISELDAIIDNARNVVLKVVAIYNEFVSPSLYEIDVFEIVSGLKRSTFSTHFV